MKERRARTSGMTMLLLALFIAGGCLFVFHNYIFGDRLMAFIDVGADTKEQYIMYYNNIVNYLREGSLPAWDFYNGYGATIYEMNFFSPFLWIVYLIGYLLGPESIAGSLVYVLMLEILLAGIFCYWMLSQFPYREDAKLLASFMYAFNGFLLLWGQHLSFGSSVVFLPLLLVFIQKSFNRKRALFGVALVSGLALVSNYYLGYMVLLGTGIYVFIRVLLYETSPWKQRLKQFFALAFSMAFGIALSAISLFPNFAAISNSSRLSSDQSMISRLLGSFKLWEREYYRTMLYRLFGTNLQGAGTAYLGHLNYYEAPILFFSVLFIFVLFEYLLTIHKKNCLMKQKLVRYLTVAIVIFSVMIEAGSLPFNAFAYRFARQTFLFMPFFAWMSADVLTNTFSGGTFSWIGLVLSTISIAAVYGKSYANYVKAEYETNALILGVSGIVMMIVIVLIRRRKLDMERAVMVLFAALFISTVSDSSLSFRFRDTVSKLDPDYFTDTYSGDTIDALQWIEDHDDSGFYRVEKDYKVAAGFLESMAQHYYGVSTYDSKPTEDQQEFFDYLWPQTNNGYDTIHHTFRNSVHEDTMATLSGVKYVLSKEPELNVGGYELVHKQGKIYIFRNTETENIAKFYTNTATEGTFASAWNSLEIWNLIPEVLITDRETQFQLSSDDLEVYEKVEIPDVIDVDATPNITIKDGVITMSALDTSTLYLNAEALEGYERLTAEFTINSDGDQPLDIFAGDSRQIFYMNHTTKEYRISLPLGTTQIDFDGYILDVEYEVTDFHIYGSERTQFSDEAEIVVNSPDGSTVTGSVNASTDGYVMLAIPYQKGWKLEVDGEEAQVTRGDFQFISFPVSKGEHTFKVYYNAPALKWSSVVSAGSLLLWLIALIAAEIAAFIMYRKRKTSAASSDRTAGVQAREFSTSEEMDAAVSEQPDTDDPFATDYADSDVRQAMEKMHAEEAEADVHSPSQETQQNEERNLQYGEDLSQDMLKSEVLDDHPETDQNDNNQ